MTTPFQSFWMAGFECADHQNFFGNRVDFAGITGHRDLLREDYERLRPFGIRAVREGIQWSLVEVRPYQYDFSEVARTIHCAQAAGVQVVWDICHFGFPDDLHPLHPHFADRFAALCRAFVRFYRDLQPDGELIITPINEVSFLSWLCGDAGCAAPWAKGMGWDVKYHLMRSFIQGVYAAREEDASVKILTTEPLVQIVPEYGFDDDSHAAAQAAHGEQFQSLDMLLGRICPELGGREDLADILGFNFYYNNHYSHHTREGLSWCNEPYDERWLPLDVLLATAHARYDKPFILSETSHPGDHRPQWIQYIGNCCEAALRNGLPLQGVCIYPIIDRPDWDHLAAPWHHSGLWDAGADYPADGLGRVLNEPFADALMDAMSRVSHAQRQHAHIDLLM